MSTSPLILAIEGNSREDGPGIRSVVFFKGCPLSCIWCQNPESKQAQPELWWDEDACIRCDDCITACPVNAISFENPHFIDRSSCDLCRKCVDICPCANALHVSGSVMSVDGIVSRVIRYKPFFDTSGGGVTLSGGEPAMHMGFTSSLLQAFKSLGIHTLIETAGLFNLDQFRTLILPHTDMIYFDVKLIDPAAHKRLCGVGNETILQNFTELLELSKTSHFDLIPRTPLIPGLTDLPDDIKALARFYRHHGARTTRLLPGNPAWFSKLNCIGQSDPFDCGDPIRRSYDAEQKHKIRLQFESYGITAIFS